MMCCCSSREKVDVADPGSLGTCGVSKCCVIGVRTISEELDATCDGLDFDGSAISSVSSGEITFALSSVKADFLTIAWRDRICRDLAVLVMCPDRDEPNPLRGFVESCSWSEDSDTYSPAIRSWISCF